MENIYLKTGSKTQTYALAKSVAENIKTGKVVIIDAIGSPANYTTIKSIIIASGTLMSFGIDLNYRIQFIDVETPEPNSHVRTAIRWTIVKK